MMKLLTRADKQREEERPKGFDDFELTLGDILRGERATQGKTLNDINRELRIQTSYIIGIENADPSAFDTPGFIAGYVRSYAKYLNMDPEWAFQKFCEESGFTTAHGMSDAALPMRKEGAALAAASLPKGPLEKTSVPFVPPQEPFLQRINAAAVGSLAVLLCLVGGLGYGAMQLVKEVQQVQVVPIDEPPMATSDLDPLANRSVAVDTDSGLTGELAANTAPTPDALDRLYRPQALDVPVFVPRDGPISGIDPQTSGIFAPQIDLPMANLEDEATGDAVAAASQVVEDAPKQITIFAVRGVWARVLAADGSKVFEKVMDAGEEFIIPVTEDPITLARAGNSGSLYFKVNGTVVGPAGPGTSVAKNIVLTEENLLETYSSPEGEIDPALSKTLEQFAQVQEADLPETDAQ